MSEIRIKCPTCGKVLRLEETPNINAAFFTCPVCKGKHMVGNCQRYNTAPHPPSHSNEETRFGSAGTQQMGGEETILGEETRIAPPQTKVGQLVDANGVSYPLSIGFNTIGRKATTSTASIQIATDDRTMSRNHTVIEVRNIGGQLLHILKNGDNKNPSYLNNVLMGEDDKLILNDGDCLKLGYTILTFKK